MSNLVIYEDEFMALATFAMINDNPEQAEDVDINTLHLALDKIANSLGFKSWIDAYHKL